MSGIVDERRRQLARGNGSEPTDWKARAEQSEAREAELRKAARAVVDCWGVGRLNITTMTDLVAELGRLTFHRGEQS